MTSLQQTTTKLWKYQINTFLALCDVSGSGWCFNTVRDDGCNFSNLFLPHFTVALSAKPDCNAHVVLWGSTNALQLHVAGVTAMEKKRDMIYPCYCTFQVDSFQMFI